MAGVLVFFRLGVEARIYWMLGKFYLDSLAWISRTIFSKTEVLLWLCFKDKNKNFWLLLILGIQRNLLMY